MSHPFRHDLTAALARIEQLEAALAESRGNAPLAAQLWDRARAPLAVGVVAASLFGGIGFSGLVVSNMDEELEPDFYAAAADISGPSSGSSVRSQIVTVSPRGLSAWQIGDVASSKAADLNAACGSAIDPVGLTLELDVAADGTVSRALARGPEALARCTERAAQQWTFPLSDGPTHAQVPLYFRPSLATGARPVAMARSDKTEPTVASETGTLAVMCAPACDAVLEDGVPLGRSPILAHPSSPGRHTVELIAGTRRHTVYTHVYPHQVAEVREDLTDFNDPEDLAVHQGTDQGVGMRSIGVGTAAGLDQSL
jgi:hypothetical protein